MVAEKDLMEGIAECLIGEPTPEKMIRLAAYYSVKDRLFGDVVAPQTYSREMAPSTVESTDNTEFLRAVKGKDTRKVMDLMDELMEAVQILQPRVYDGVMRRLSDI